MLRSSLRNTPGAEYSDGFGNPVPCSDSDSEESETSAMQPDAPSPSMSEVSEYGSSTMPQAVSDTPSLFVSNISRADVPDQDNLLKAFREFGKVVDAYFVKKQGPGDCECAVVHFLSWSEAEVTLKRYEEHVLNKERDWLSVPVVRYARPRAGMWPHVNAISPRRLFIGQLPESVGEEQVRGWFSQFGDIEDISMLYRKDEFAGCGFVQYTTWASCDTAISETHGNAVFDSEKEQRSPLVVRYARAAKCFYNRDNRLLRENQDMEAMASAGGWHCNTSPTHYCYGQMVPILYDYIAADQSYMPAVVVSSGFHCMSPIAMQGSIDLGSQESVDSRKIFVGQLPKDYTEEHLRAIFAPFGNIEDITLLRDGKESKCCGFVTYTFRIQALGAIEGANKARVNGGSRPLVVRLAYSRRQR